MPQTYTPGPKADAIVDALLALCRYETPEEVVRAALHLLSRQDAELKALMRRVGASDAEIAADQVRWQRYARGDEGASDTGTLGNGMHRRFGATAVSKAYVPGPEADAIVQQQLAKCYYSDADDVVRVGLLLLQQSEAELEELSRLIEDEQASYDHLKESRPRVDPVPELAPIPGLHRFRQE